MTRRIVSVIAGVIILSACGCGPPAFREPVFIPMSEATGIVKQNNELINRDEQQKPLRLYGKGRWSGSMINPQGQREDLDGGFNLHVHWPTNLCFMADAGVLTNKLFEAGCDAQECWFWQQYELDTLIIDTRRQWSSFSAGQLQVQLRPDALMEALGLQFLEPDTSSLGGPSYRVANDHHQLIYEDMLEDGRRVIVKEFWLSRYEPYLIERVLYRQSDGRVVMDARLREHRPVDNGEALIAREIDIHWPLKEWELKLRFDRVKLYEDMDNDWLRRPLDRPSPPHPQPKHIKSLSDLVSVTSEQRP